MDDDDDDSLPGKAEILGAPDDFRIFVLFFLENQLHGTLNELARALVINIL